MRTGAWPGDSGARGTEKRGVGNDLGTHLQGNVAPMRAPAVQVGAVEKIADANRGADADIGQALEMVDKVFAGEIFLGHGAFDDVLETVMAVQVGHGGHHGFAGKVDVRGASGNF